MAWDVYRRRDRGADGVDAARSPWRRCALPLNLLSPDEIAQYLDIAAPVSGGKDKLLNAVYKHSEGNPLFMISALRHLKTTGALRQSGGKWWVNPGLEEMELTIPPNISGFLVHSIEQLDSADQLLLRIGSIQGIRFDSATLSDVSGIPPVEVEERLRTLARVHELIQYLGETSFNDGTHTDHYHFIHRLFWKLFQDSTVHSRRSELASRITESRAKREPPRP